MNLQLANLSLIRKLDYEFGGKFKLKFRSSTLQGFLDRAFKIACIAKTFLHKTPNLSWTAGFPVLHIDRVLSCSIMFYLIMYVLPFIMTGIRIYAYTLKCFFAYHIILHSTFIAEINNLRKFKTDFR